VYRFTDRNLANHFNFFHVIPPLDNILNYFVTCYNNYFTRVVRTAIYSSFLSGREPQANPVETLYPPPPAEMAFRQSLLDRLTLSQKFSRHNRLTCVSHRDMFVSPKEKDVSMMTIEKYENQLRQIEKALKDGKYDKALILTKGLAKQIKLYEGVK
jgi:hypothetical protein